MNWVFISFTTMVIVTVMDILYRYIMKKGYKPFDIVFYPFIIGILVALIWMLIGKHTITKFKCNIDCIVFIILGILFFMSFILLRNAQSTSPNIGYVNSIVYSSAVFTIILTSIVYGDHISIKAILGGVLILSGLFLITCK